MQANRVAEVSPISMSEFKDLAAASGPCVSILLPVEAKQQPAQNPVRLKNAIKTVERMLIERGADSQQTREILDPISELTEDTRHWTDELEGLALFRSPDLLRAFRVPGQVVEWVSVADHFYVKPLLPLLHSDRNFYILALSQKHIRLLRCTGQTSEEVPLPDSVPKTLWDDSRTEAPDHDQENRGAAGPSTGSMKGVVSSTNTDREARDEYLLHFYKHVGKGVADRLKDESAPLVIAGVDYEIALFRRENSYPHLAEDAVHGAADALKGGELHKRALEAVQPFFEAPLKQALARFEQQAGSERASSTAKEIVKAAFDGRVSDLVLSEGTQYMGNFDEATQRVRGHKQPLAGDEDLLNAAAVQTILHSGQVFVVPPNKVPHGAPAVAVFRY
jgi:Bacterial archaeo-eukaryotic release factor family 3